MNRFIALLLVLVMTSACAGTPTQADIPIQTPPQPVPTTMHDPTSGILQPTEVVAVSTIPVPEDFFSRMNITLPAPVCNGLTQPQMEGPYYTPNTPERNSLLEDEMQGTRLILVGYVLDQNCNPLANAWLDFWQTDANGEYDNVGYRLRGHQFTDLQGRYYLETILPGLYLSRPIEHIHVKVKPQGGEDVTSQLYFPDQPVGGLTITLEERGGHFIGYFNFVVEK
ncbi:MAG TPA: hypothetical protein VIS72_10705 [Anaerolineales bacterium]